MRLNEKVGGEPWNEPGAVNFNFDAESMENEFGLKFDAVFAYDSKLFSFYCTKVRDLGAGVQAADFIALQQRWDYLENPKWYEDKQFESGVNYEGGATAFSTLLWRPLRCQAIISGRGTYCNSSTVTIS